MPEFVAEIDDVLSAIQLAGRSGMLTLLHCEDGALVRFVGSILLAQDRGTVSNWALSRPQSAERAALERAVAICEATGSPIYIVHLSSAAALDSARRGQARGLPVFVETRPLYLYLTSADLETMLPMLFSEGVRTGRISLSRFVSLISTSPARLFGLYPRKGTIAVGSDADLVVLDPQRVGHSSVNGASHPASAGRACRAPLTLERPLPTLRALTARARPEARPETRAANLRSRQPIGRTGGAEGPMLLFLQIYLVQPLFEVDLTTVSSFAMYAGAGGSPGPAR